MLDRYGFVPADLRSQALITSKGAILIGKHSTVDAHEDRPVRVVTHAHSDHTLGLRESARKCNRLVMTPATYEPCPVLHRLKPDPSRLVLLDYGRSFEYDGERLTLYDAGHVLGSAQVLVEGEDGYRLLYTGDFKLPKAPIIESDLLVIDATYGKPSRVRPFEDKIEDEFVRLVRASLKEGSVYIFGYHGKLQEVAGILRRGGIDVPVEMPKRVYEVAKICQKHGMKLGDFSLARKERKGVLREKRLGLYHMRSARSFKEIGSDHSHA
jgi:putative mRNA 3-end processing factor